MNSKSAQPSQAAQHSKSHKSDSGSKRQPRLYRTLKRRPRARIIEEDDLKWVWAAYKKHSLNDTNGEAIFPDGLKPDEFNDIFRKLLTRERITCWICTVKNQPVGLVMATNQIGMTLILTFCWFSWASKRNIIESAVNFINHFRSELNMIGYVESYKDFFVHIAKHGIIRRAGTIELDTKMAIYQSRR